MKKENGITLVSLVIYVIIMSIVILVMSSIINTFYKNTDAVKGDTEEVVQFSKFNNYFLKEVKTKNNEVDTIGSNYILFKSGNSFSLSDNVIYYNNKEICYDVNEMDISLGENGDEKDKTIVNVSITFKNFSKSISYKIEDIY